jgi:xylose isomerase
MRSYLILKEKARQFNEDAEIQALLAEINAGDDELGDLAAVYSADKAAHLKALYFDRQAMAGKRLAYERLDQLTFDLLMGVR